MKTATVTLAKSVILTAAAVVLATATNAARTDGIPLVTDIPYEIFSACKDAEAVSEAVSANDVDLKGEKTLTVDAGPKTQYDKEHVKGALNVPYSALFGASPADIEKVKQAAEAQNASIIAVYGSFKDPENPTAEVDFAKSLADQLLEAGLPNVHHIKGGLEAMKKQGAKTVQGKAGE